MGERAGQFGEEAATKGKRDIGTAGIYIVSDFEHIFKGM